MFEALSHSALQYYWWFIVSVLGATLVFLLFVQGGQTLLYKIGKTEQQRNLIVNLLGRKWELTFTTLVTFGGAFFAAFPLFYSTSFGGAYWVWILILFAFVVQAVSYEYRRKPNNFLGQKTFEKFLFFNGLVGTVLLGAAVSTFFTGAEFSVNKLNLVNLTRDTMPVISEWKSPFYGLEAVFTLEHWAFLQNLALGIAVFFLSRVLALLYFIKNLNDNELVEKSRKALVLNTLIFLPVFLFWLIRLMTLDGFGVYPDTEEVFKEPFKYFHNLIEQPLLLVLLLAGLVGVLYGLFLAIVKKKENGILFTGSGAFLTVLTLFLLAGYNDTAFYPSTYDLQSSLTLENSSSSKFTLTVMSYVSVIVPIVVLYIWNNWRKMNKQKLSSAEVEKDGHSY